MISILLQALNQGVHCEMCIMGVGDLSEDFEFEFIKTVSKRRSVFAKKSI